MPAIFHEAVKFAKILLKQQQQIKYGINFLSNKEQLWQYYYL